MGEHKFTKHSAEPKNDGADTSHEMMVRMEVGFYRGWCELMQVAFKKDGIMGVLGLTSEIVNLGPERLYWETASGEGLCSNCGCHDK